MTTAEQITQLIDTGSVTMETKEVPAFREAMKENDLDFFCFIDGKTSTITLRDKAYRPIVDSMVPLRKLFGDFKDIYSHPFGESTSVGKNH